MKYARMLPFLDEEDLDELVENIKSGKIKDIKIAVLYPFLSKETLETLVDYLIKEKRSKDLSRSLPFLSRKKVNEIYEGINNGSITGINEYAIMPFLGKEKIKEMFHKSIKESSENKEDLDEDDEE